MAYAQATASEIDRKLREDFRRRLREFGVSAEATDPILAVLFRTFAGQIESLYNETGRIRLALLDELIEGLGLERRMARPAQVVVRFAIPDGVCTVEAGTELAGTAQSGERLTFALDAPVLVSPARIAFAAAYQDGYLQLMPGLDVSEEIQQGRPILEPVRASIGPNPALFLAIDSAPDIHLGRHAFCFDLTPDAGAIGQALASETWCVFGNDGELRADGILRPRRANAGVRQLEWLVRADGTAEDSASADSLPDLPDGFYSGRIFVWPSIPSWRRYCCRVPRAMYTPLGRMFQAPVDTVLNRNRVWLRISMPREIGPLATGVANVWLHAASASNVECLNQTVYFDRHGASVPISREGGTSKYLVAPLSIMGGGASSYLQEFQPSRDRNAGRYAIRSGRIHVSPAQDPAGRVDEYVNLRLWVTNGTAGNRIGPGDIESFLRKPPAPGLRVTNPTSAAGATDGEGFGDAQARFAQALLSRDRIVTRADLSAAIRAFDRRIRDVTPECGLVRKDGALQRVQRISIRASQDDFIDPETESRILIDELSNWLRHRFLYDLDLVIALEWT